MNELQSMLHESVSRLFEDELDWDSLTRYEKVEWPESLWDKVTEKELTRSWQANPLVVLKPLGVTHTPC